MRVEKGDRLTIHEDQLQVQCITWFKLQYPKFEKRIWHPANGGSRNLREATKFKRMGVLPGVCDIIITIPRKGYSGLFCELKVANRKLTKHQEEFIELHEKDYNIHVVRTLEQFQNAVINYLG